MTIQTINTATPNSGKGDSLFSAFTKINANFTELYDEIAGIEVGAVSWNVITDKPDIPTDISDLTDNQGLLATTFDGDSTTSEFNEEETIDGGGA